MISKLTLFLLLSSYLSYSFAFHNRAALHPISIGCFNKYIIRSSSELISDEEKDFILIQRIEKEVMAESGVTLEELINPSRVINLSRDIENLTEKLKDASTSESVEIQKQIDKKSRDLLTEKRAVFRGWLKNLFVFQSALALVFSLFMVYDSVPNMHLPLAVRVLGFWMWWLFIIPSMRARKPSKAEKEALNWAFLGSPLVSVALPSVTKDPVLIWWANLVVVVGCYVWAFSKPPVSEGDEGVDEGEAGDEKSGSGEGLAVPGFLKAAYKALDYGSGQERGLRK